ncbi:hypothetical protein HK405_005940 [Cladochytrium tenue]|nr:hypothetical protein HK405_005940 [Cladochytrium tenue]
MTPAPQSSSTLPGPNSAAQLPEDSRLRPTAAAGDASSRTWARHDEAAIGTAAADPEAATASASDSDAAPNASSNSSSSSTAVHTRSRPGPPQRQAPPGGPGDDTSTSTDYGTYARTSSASDPKAILERLTDLLKKIINDPKVKVTELQDSIDVLRLQEEDDEQRGAEARSVGVDADAIDRTVSDVADTLQSIRDLQGEDEIDTASRTAQWLIDGINVAIDRVDDFLKAHVILRLAFTFLTCLGKVRPWFILATYVTSIGISPCYKGLSDSSSYKAGPGGNESKGFYFPEKAAPIYI